MDRSRLRRTIVAVLVSVVVVWAVAASLYFTRTGRLPIPVPRLEHDALAHDLETLTVGGDVLFEYRSAALRPRGTGTLDDVAVLIGDHPAFTIYVDGHADATGDADYNWDLSLHRAAAVVAYLVEHGVATQQLVARGFGETRPRAPNDSAAGRTLNRRVEFTLE